MQERFTKYIKRSGLFTDKNKLLLGVSGGRDSMVLADLLHKAGYFFAVAHCNFKLRGDEANIDETFVESHFKAKGIQIFCTSFNTKDYSDKHNLSIQMAARELRYSWFEKIRSENNFDLILTAHTSTDNVETFFINLIRGSGLNGLKGIPEKNNLIVRPLLSFSRDDVDQYVKQHSIPYREDSSNAEVKYLRNKIRNELMPFLKEINPSIEQTVLQEMSIIKESHDFQTSIIREKINSLQQTHENQTTINIQKLKDTGFPVIILHDLLLPFGFPAESAGKIMDSLSRGLSGKQFFSTTHQLLIDRENIIVKHKTGLEENSEMLIEEDLNKIVVPIHLSFTKEDGAVVHSQKNKACLDHDKLKYPLLLRKWQEGDMFVPMGMSGRKKLSDFFVSEKMNLFEKQEQWVLCAGIDIVWVIGRRVDNRYKVSDDTKKTLVIELKHV